MGNLNYSPTDILLNSVSVDKVGLYFHDLGNNTGQAMLLIKDLGISIPGAIYSLSQGSPDSLLHKPTSCAFNCVNPGQLKVVRYVFTPVCPCEECDYEYGITIHHKDSSKAAQIRYFPPPQKYLGGRFERVECTAGFIDDTYVNRAELDIIRQNMADQYSFVNIWRQYDVGDFAAGETIGFTLSVPGEDDLVVSVLWDDDSAGTPPDPEDFDDFLTNINTALDGTGVTAIGDESTGTVTLVGDYGLQFTISQNAYAARYLYVGQKYPEVTFDVTYPQDMATGTVITEPRFPSLRGVDVYQEFMNRGNHGSMAIFSSVERPDPAADYCKWTFTYVKPYTYDLVGANHLNQYYHVYHLYVKKSAIIDLIGDDILYWVFGYFNVEIPGAIKDIDISMQMLVDILCGTIPQRGN